MRFVAADGRIVFPAAFALIAARLKNHDHTIQEFAGVGPTVATVVVNWNRHP
jgi:hypothetical protein